MGASVGQIVRQAAVRSPQRIALCDVGRVGDSVREVTYAELDWAARSAAAVLVANGVEPGQRVALCAENSLQLMAAWFGVIYAGAAVVPIPILSAAPEVAYRLRHARVGLLLHDAARATLANDAVREAGGVRGIELGALQDPAVAPLRYPLDVSPAAAAMVLYTSGTTGQAKGAEISHASLLLHTSSLVQHALGLGEHDVVLSALPLTHSYGIRMAMLAPLYAQARIVLVPRFSAERTLELVATQGVTWLPAVPTMLAAWARLEAAPASAALRWVLSAGAPLPDELARRAEVCLGAQIRQGYGMTEATFATINAPPDARVLGSVGRPSWGVELRIVDGEGRDVTPGEGGEVLVRGHNQMTRYLYDPEASAEVTRDGFMRSGDVGRIDADGRLWIVDRIKDLVIRGGYNVYPSEVEDVLARHPDVAEVAVIGRPDPVYGEELIAVIVPRPGRPPDLVGLAELARARLSRSKWPREYAFIEHMPLGGSGKVQKRELRQWWREGRLLVIAAPA